MKILKTLISVALLLMVSAVARGGIRPSFLPEQCSWRATDIVVVTEGTEIDGVFTVLETLKGDLKPGATIKIAEMADFKAKAARTVKPWWGEAPQAGKAELVTGERMLLFLRDRTKADSNTEIDDDDLKKRAAQNQARWQAANLMGDEIKYSTVWIEHGLAYYFIQVENPGPSLLTKTGLTEGELKKAVAEIIAVQNGLSAAIAVQDPERKALSLEPFLHNEIYLAREKAFDEIINCDDAALPVLKRILNDQSLIWIHATVIDAYEAVGGKKIGADLVSVIKRETEYWKQRAPTLNAGWRNVFDSKGDSALLRTHWGILQQALVSLKDIKYPESFEAVADVSQLMRTMPQIYSDDVNNTCDAILRTLRGKGELPPIPSYELRLSGNKVFSTQKLKEVFEQALTEYQHLEKPDDQNMWNYAVDSVGAFISSQGYTAMGSGPSPSASDDDSDVVISSVRVADHTQSAIGTNKQGVVVFLHVNEGVPYRLGSVRIVGARLLPAEEIRGMLPLQSGDVCDWEAIWGWRERIEQTYKNRGYLQVSVDDENDLSPPLRATNAGTANFKITLNEGRRFKVQSIKFEGKSDLPAPRLLASLKLADGDTYSEEKLNTSLDALNTLGLDLDRESDVLTDEDEEHGTVSIVIMLDKRTSRRAAGRNQLQRRVRRIFN